MIVVWQVDLACNAAIFGAKMEDLLKFSKK
jgi:hypothetical protein